MKEESGVPYLLVLIFWLFIGVGSVFVAWQALFLWLAATVFLSAMLKHGKE